MKKRSAQRGRPALDLIEDAVHLLRTVPLSTLLAYYIGAIPFALGLLYFWADMSRGAFAQRRCVLASFAMALLFLWLKCWQSVFAAKLHERVAALASSTWTMRRIFQLVLVQGALQPSRLIVHPISLVLTIPFGWVTAFYENVTVLGDGSEPDVRAVMKKAAGQARFWQGQNHAVLAIFTLLALFVWLNAAILIVSVPSLLKMFLGMETAFTRAGMWIIWNTTFLAATVVVAWLALDPLLKAVYVYRCFHGAARNDGADLIAELSRVRASKTLALAAFLAWCVLAPLACSADSQSAENTSGALRVANSGVPLGATVSPTQMDDAIKRTLQQEKYAWRLPRETIIDDKENEGPTKTWIRAFLAGIGDAIKDGARAVRDVVRAIFDWFDKHFHRNPPPAGQTTSEKTDWMVVLRGFAYVLLALSAVALLWLLFRLWRQASRTSKLVRAEVIPIKPDLSDEHLTAAQLPEDEWLKLGREMIEKGELRLALRAFYLASLAHLASREIVSIAQFKSNLDYEREVNRRARALSDLRAAFSENVGSFERVWYGLYDVTGETMAQFQSNLERIRSC
jgi:hypothetical protein